MPSPFPGMDPYLEDPTRWPGLHERMIVYIADALQPLVQPRYYVETGERIYFELPPSSIYPDVTLHRTWPEPRARGTALVSPDEPVLVDMGLRHRDPFLEIRAAASEVVAVLEVVSPADKWPSGKGREEYVSKQERVYASEAHLIEIDLLRRGTPVVLGAQGGWSLPRFDYVAAVSRATTRPNSELYPFTIRDRLPRMRIPLREPDPDVTLDLPAVFDRCYDNGAYVIRLDYNQPPPEPLRPEDAEWADALVRAAGVRGTGQAGAGEQG